MNIFQSTADAVMAEAAKHNSVLVSFSGGKDSLAVLDLCKKSFREVKCFFMYAVPGFRCTQEYLDKAQDIYQVEILQFPHWIVFQWFRHMVYCDEYKAMLGLPDIKLKDIYKQAREETGIKLIATGAKKADSLWRKRYLSNLGEGYKNTFNPIADWNKFDVLAYLKINKIPYPESSTGTRASGIDLSVPSLLWLHDNHPDDFRLLLQYFPYAEAAVKRRQYYGIG